MADARFPSHADDPCPFAAERRIAIIQNSSRDDVLRCRGTVVLRTVECFARPRVCWVALSRRQFASAAAPQFLPSASRFTVSHLTFIITPSILAQLRRLSLFCAYFSIQSCSGDGFSARNAYTRPLTQVQ